jgi:hypothetical protein
MAFSLKTIESIPLYAGSKWTDAEERQLLSEVQTGKTMNEIASIHRRTVRGIKARLSRMIRGGRAGDATEGRVGVADAKPSPEKAIEILKVKEIVQVLKPGQKLITTRAEGERSSETLKEIKEILLRIEEKIDSK